MDVNIPLPSYNDLVEACNQWQEWNHDLQKENELLKKKIRILEAKSKRNRNVGMGVFLGLLPHN